MKKYILLLLFINSNIVYTQDHTQTNKQIVSVEEIKEDPNAKFKTDTVSFAVTTSLLGTGYFKGNPVFRSQTSLEVFVGSPKTTSYFYHSLQFIVPILAPSYSHIFSRIILDIGFGYGNWVYKNLDSNKKKLVLRYKS